MQTASAQTQPANGTAAFADASISVDRMARMGTRELEALYRTGRVPASLKVLNGTPAGRMLTLVGPLGRGLSAAAIRSFAAAQVFPWRGKSFDASEDARGRGINRAILLGDLFPFDTFVGASVVDGEPAVILDYDQPENPAFIRAIHDEIREVSPGVFLGPAMLKVRGGHRLVLHFAIDTTA